MKAAVLLGMLALLEQGHAHGAPLLQERREPHTGMIFVALPKACYQMGSASPVAADTEHLWAHLGMNAPLSEDEHPPHEVCIDNVWIGKHEVTAAQWARVMSAPPPSGKDDAPAAGMAWVDAQRFAARLSERPGGQGRFRLPTEAEWEYACRAGSADVPIAVRDEHKHIAWYSTRGHRRIEPAPIGKLAANAWGIHDMLGNVWEWTADAYRSTAYAEHQLYNPSISGTANDNRVIRGASHRSSPQEVRCANRAWYSAKDGLPQIGLRLVWEP